MVGFSPALRFLLGHQKDDGKPSFASWCPGGELGAGVGAAVGLLGARVVGYAFALDIVSVTCKL